MCLRIVGRRVTVLHVLVGGPARARRSAPLSPPRWATGHLLPALDRPRRGVPAPRAERVRRRHGHRIIANAAITLPIQIIGQRSLALTVWLGAGTLPTVLIAATVTRWVRHPAQPRRHISNPVISHFCGAPPMAMLTAGAAPCSSART